MPIPKDEGLTDVIQAAGTKTGEFEHKGRKIVVEYVKPTVSMINEARDQAMVINQKGRQVTYRLKIFDFEVYLLSRCLKDSNIPGIPQGGHVALRNINDPDLWTKLLVACEVKEGEVQSDDFVTVVQQAIEEMAQANIQHPALDRIRASLEFDRESEDVKK